MSKIRLNFPLFYVIERFAIQEPTKSSLIRTKNIPDPQEIPGDLEALYETLLSPPSLRKLQEF